MDQKQEQSTSESSEVTPAQASLHSTVKQLVLISTTQVYPLIRHQVLLNTREQLIGVDKIKECIEHGYMPEQISTILNQGELQKQMQVGAMYIALLSLGVALVQVSQPLKAILPGATIDDISPDKAQQATQALQLNLAHLLSQPEAGDDVDSLPAIDYDPLTDYIVMQQEEGGLLYNDPAWEDLSKKNKTKWDRRLSEILSGLGKAFNDAVLADENKWRLEMKNILAAVELDDGQKALQVLLSQDSTRIHSAIVAGPSLSSGLSDFNLAQKSDLYCKAAYDFKAQLQTLLLARAVQMQTEVGKIDDTDDTTGELYGTVEHHTIFKIYESILKSPVNIDEGITNYKYDRLPLEIILAWGAAKASGWFDYETSIKYYNLAAIWLKRWLAKGSQTPSADADVPLPSHPASNMVEVFKKSVLAMSTDLNVVDDDYDRVRPEHQTLSPTEEQLQSQKQLYQACIKDLQAERERVKTKLALQQKQKRARADSQVNSGLDQVKQPEKVDETPNQSDQIVDTKENADKHDDNGHQKTKLGQSATHEDGVADDIQDGLQKVEINGSATVKDESVDSNQSGQEVSSAQ
ncbi:unnamed protein product [Sympodiomycopsis kandeliae]